MWHKIIDIYNNKVDQTLSFEIIEYYIQQRQHHFIQDMFMIIKQQV